MMKFLNKDSLFFFYLMQKPTYCFRFFLLAAVACDYTLGHERGTRSLIPVLITKPGFANSSVVTVPVARCKLQ